MDDKHPRLLAPLTLAYVGDGVFELLVRERIVALHGSMMPHKLHALAVSVVCAEAQALLFDRLEPMLTDEEHDILRRGRNASGMHPPKNADPAQYRKATAVEALFGYLHLTGQFDRMRELFEQVEIA